MVHPARIAVLKPGPESRGPVVYWMSRDQRVRDNHALSYAREIAEWERVPVIVAFALAPSFPGATLRAYEFMIGGLERTAATSAELGMPFALLSGEPGETVPEFIRAVGAGALVTDFDPLRFKHLWKNDVLERIGIPAWEVDARNVVPCREASDKREAGARTIRRKIMSRLGGFLTDFPPVVPHPYPLSLGAEPDWDAARRFVRADPTVQPVPGMGAGEDAASEALGRFIGGRLARYGSERNDPNADALSGLSPYLHFGQLSAQRVALEVTRAEGIPSESRDAFIEELVVRRELADNFCLHEPAYDNIDGIPAWARATLDRHRADPRPHIYSRAEFEAARTHDDLWNAAQSQMAKTGSMHSYLRMYWAKKILEWSPDPETAIGTAIYLNDRFELDGRDANGYTGVLWSIGGLHDRPWAERPVFGMVRYMNENGCRRKFDVEAYKERYLNH